MVQYANIDDWFEQFDKEEAEMKAKEAIAFAKWLCMNYAPTSQDTWAKDETRYSTETLYIKFKSK